MPAPYLGGFRILSVNWIGLTAIELAFQATEYSDKLFQLYAGRRLIGVTEAVTDRIVRGAVPPGPRATPLSLIVVDKADRLVDYGDLLGWKPYNLYCVRWQAPAVIGDLSHFDVVMSNNAGEAYDATNIVGRVEYNSQISTYTFELPSIATSGNWQVAVIPRDDAEPSGNAGTIDTVTIAAVVYPLDLALDENGQRFTVAATAGELTASFAYGS
jgi:hypothetical protein